MRPRLWGIHAFPLCFTMCFTDHRPHAPPPYQIASSSVSPVARPLTRPTLSSELSEACGDPFCGWMARSRCCCSSLSVASTRLSIPGHMLPLPAAVSADTDQERMSIGRGVAVQFGLARCRQLGSRTITSPLRIVSRRSGSSPLWILRWASATGKRWDSGANSNGPFRSSMSHSGQFICLCKSNSDHGSHLN